MSKLVRLKKTRGVWPMRLAVSTVTVAVTVTGATGAVAAHASAARAGFRNGASHLRDQGEFRHPRLSDGLLSIKGTSANDNLTVRLAAGHPDVLEVDAGTGGPSFTFKRDNVDAIVVNARGGDDVVRMDEANGVFTDRIPTTV